MPCATGNRPFWAERTDWVRTDPLQSGQGLRLAEAGRCKVSTQKPVYRTLQQGVGWVVMGKDIETSYGSHHDYVRGEFIQSTTEPYLEQEVRESADPYLRVRVCQIEVEDFHPCHVGGCGIWVRDGC